MRHEGVARVIAALPPSQTGRDCLPQATHMAHVTHHTALTLTRSRCVTLTMIEHIIMVIKNQYTG